MADIQTIFVTVPKQPVGQRQMNSNIGMRSCQRKSTEFCIRSTYQPSCLRVINHFGNRPIPNTLNRFVNHMERNQEPLSRLDRISESVLDGQVELRCAEQAVEDVFQFGAIQVVELVGGDHLHVGQ